VIEALRSETHLDVPLPSGTTQGDVLVLGVYNDFDNTFVVPDGGWTMVTRQSSALSSFASTWFWRRADSVEPAALRVGVVGAGPTGVTATLAAYGGVTAVGPAASNIGGSSSALAPSLSLGTAAQVLVMPVADTLSVPVQWTPPAPLATRLDQTRVGLFELSATTPGQVGPFSVGISATVPWAAATLALTPKDAGAPDAGGGGGGAGGSGGGSTGGGTAGGGAGGAAGGSAAGAGAAGGGGATGGGDPTPQTLSVGCAVGSCSSGPQLVALYLAMLFVMRRRRPPAVEGEAGRPPRHD
jgi:hypothetical protein